MTVAQINSIYHIVKDAGLTEDKKVNLTQWRDHTHVTMNLMKPDGEVWRYEIQRDGDWIGEET